MNKITIEEINGKEFTIVRKPYNAEWVKDELEIGCVVLEKKGNQDGKQGWIYMYSIHQLDDLYYQDIIKDVESVIVAVLPALPRHPKPEDAPLLYKYMSEGLMPVFDGKKPACDYLTTRSIEGIWMLTITHATHNNELIKIAIKE